MHSTYETTSIKNFQSIPQLTKDLLSKNFLLRKKARNELIEIGEPSLDYLVKLAHSKDENVRWEAMITIVQISGKNTLNVLLDALEDNEFSIRWLAAEGLIDLGKYAIVPLLQELLDKPHSTFLRRGAHHILNEFRELGLFEDYYALVETLANEFDHSNIVLKVQKTLNANRLT